MEDLNEQGSEGSEIMYTPPDKIISLKEMAKLNEKIKEEEKAALEKEDNKDGENKPKNKRSARISENTQTGFQRKALFF